VIDNVVRDRAVTAAVSFAIIGGATGISAATSGEFTLDGMTRVQAERISVSGRFFDPQRCPTPTRVRCRPRGKHGDCKVTFANGAEAAGDPGFRQAQIQSDLC
jgi:hypothetical protein